MQGLACNIGANSTPLNPGLVMGGATLGLISIISYGFISEIFWIRRK